MSWLRRMNAITSIPKRRHVDMARTTSRLRILTTGFQFPKGPAALDDEALIFIEKALSTRSGFCGHGEGAALTENDGNALGGRLPVNTGGDSLSEVYLHGFNMITEVWSRCVGPRPGR